MTDRIKITKEYWAQPCSIRYDYVGPGEPGHLWNVDRVKDGLVCLWSINGWGNTEECSVALERFLEEFKPYNKPSVNERMAAEQHPQEA